MNWLIFDGPADSLWVENLNTVLDENRLLCLSGGQRIKIPLNFAAIFELNDLNQISPATVTRCGMIYLDENILRVEHIFDKWIKDFV